MSTTQEKTLLERINSIKEQEKILAIERDQLLQKALKSGKPTDIYQAQKYYSQVVNQKNSLRGGKSIIIDPFESRSSTGFYEKSTTLSFDMLRGMSRVPIIKAVIGTRKDQVSEFATPQPDKYSKGFIIRKSKSGREQGQQEDPLTDQEQREVDTIIDFLLNAGEDEHRWHVDSFDTFIRKIVEDSLAMDQFCFEIVRYRNNDIAEFYATDAATFRIADTYEDETSNIEKNEIDGYLPSYCQIYQNRIISDFYPWELAYGIRNPQTSIYQNGYGRSELEDLVSTVTAMINADSYNSKFFRNGSAPKGALMVKAAGGLDSDKLNEFRSEWNSTMTGAENFHKTPILDAEKMEWLDLQKSNRDMEFSQFQEYLIKVVCAVYKISPEEVGFSTRGSLSGGSGGLGSGNREQEYDYSREKGLRPLLRTIQKYINSHLVGPKTDYKYELVFVGIDSETEQDEESRLISAGESYMELNEVREARGLDPVDYGDVVMNPIAVQAKMGGNPSSDSFMDQEDNSQFGQKMEEKINDNGDQKEKSEKNPFLEDLENWWDKEMLHNE